MKDSLKQLITVWRAQYEVCEKQMASPHTDHAYISGMMMQIKSDIEDLERLIK